MAYKTLGTYRMYEYEQEEILNIQQVVNPDTGVVEEVETLVQEYAHIWADLTIAQEIVPDENKSNILAEVWLYATAGEKGEGFTIKPYLASKYDSITFSYVRLANSDSYLIANSSQSRIPSSIQVNSGKSISQKICRFDTTKAVQGRNSGVAFNRIDTYHDINGALPIKDIFGVGKEYPFFLVYNSNSSTSSRGRMPFRVKSQIYFQVSDLTTTEENAPTTVIATKAVDPTPLSINRAPIPTTANNFTDEELNIICEVIKCA